jgi:predicted nucleic acid-binding Zn ribbon protein
MTENPDIYCEDCDGYCKRVPQIAGVSLKGKGWYKNSGRKENGEPL